MHMLRALGEILTSTDVKIQRQLKYWASTVFLYALCVGIVWYQTWSGEVRQKQAALLTGAVLAAILLFYVLIRGSKRFALSPSQLAVIQGNFAIACIVAGYSFTGPLRGASLSILMVVLVFCAFALKPEKSKAMGRFAIILLGGTMLWMVSTDPVRYPPRIEAIHFLLASTMLLVIASLTGQLSILRLRLQTQKEELANALERIRLLATRDELTTLSNRRHMNEILQTEERRRATHGKPVCLALLDIDHFKAINDRYGHATGDDVLRLFAHEVQQAVRSTDVVSRWGGEEFLLLMPETELHDARMVLERVKKRMTGLKVPNIGTDVAVTFSAGVTSLRCAEKATSAIHRADDAMYDAKMKGRNRIVISQ